MRQTSQFAPMIRNSIGFDRLFDALEQTGRASVTSDAPAYNVVRIGDDRYQIVVAVPGLTKEEIQVTYEPNLLLIAGTKTADQEGTFLHRGIPDSSFEFRFDLADHVEVTDATLADGMLLVDLTRELPEVMKPRKIAIAAPSLNDNGGQPKAA